MGLDMYLERRTSFPAKFDSENQTVINNPALDGLNIDDIDNNRVTTIVEEVKYWRKANAIHNWFVKNVQSGVDDCGIYWVSKEQLEELVDVCKLALTSDEIAMKVLPPAQGFFFGSDEIDEWYKRDLKDTIDAIEDELKDDHSNVSSDNPNNIIRSYYYSSSW